MKTGCYHDPQCMSDAQHDERKLAAGIRPHEKSSPSDALRRLAFTDPFVGAALATHEKTGRPYVEVLETLVVALSEARAAMCEAAIRAEMRAPLAPFTLPVQM